MQLALVIILLLDSFVWKGKGGLQENTCIYAYEYEYKQESLDINVNVGGGGDYCIFLGKGILRIKIMDLIYGWIWAYFTYISISYKFRNIIVQEIEALPVDIEISNGKSISVVIWYRPRAQLKYFIMSKLS